jgi:S-(hydroxymethyl)glutathione dehydrogenase / alcohol dehydrogenase
MRAAVFRQPNVPVDIEDVDIDEPLDREVLVRTVATGVCHSDLHMVDGNMRPGPQPVVLGHEGAGIVEAVGENVTTVKPGDHVVGCLSEFCGVCEQCLSGHPNLCQHHPGFAPRSNGLPRVSIDGMPLTAFGGVGSYAERMLLHENGVVKIDEEIPLASASLIGCGVLTGVGAALRTAHVEAGQTVAVFGCGGVGLSVVQGARIAGASRIIAVDQYDSKREMALQFGATDFVDSSDGDAAQKVREMTGGAGVDHALEAVGNVALVRQAAESLAIRGTLTIVGVPPAGSVLEIPFAAIRPECRVQTSRMGSNRFRIDIPRYLELYRQGRLLLDEMVSRRGKLDDINDAFRAMKAGEVARTVLTLEG